MLDEVEAHGMNYTQLSSLRERIDEKVRDEGGGRLDCCEAGRRSRRDWHDGRRGSGPWGEASRSPAQAKGRALRDRSRIQSRNDEALRWVCPAGRDHSTGKQWRTSLYRSKPMIPLASSEVSDGFRSRGLAVFWSNDIPKGAPNYQAILKDEILEAPVVVVVWTNASVHSGPVIQECSQAEKTNKLFQVLLDDIEPMDMPMEVKYKSQKTMLLGWEGDPLHPEWIKLNNAIDARLGRVPIPVEVGVLGTSETKLLLPGAGKSEWFKECWSAVPKWCWCHPAPSLWVRRRMSRDM